VKKHNEAVFQKGFEKGMLLVTQTIVIVQITIKFGKSEQANKKVRSCTASGKLDRALRRIPVAASRREVLDCLD